MLQSDPTKQPWGVHCPVIPSLLRGGAAAAITTKSMAISHSLRFIINLLCWSNPCTAANTFSGPKIQGAISERNVTQRRAPHRNDWCWIRPSEPQPFTHAVPAWAGKGEARESGIEADRWRGRPSPRCGALRSRSRPQDLVALRLTPAFRRKPVPIQAHLPFDVPRFGGRLTLAVSAVLAIPGERKSDRRAEGVLDEPEHRLPRLAPGPERGSPYSIRHPSSCDQRSKTPSGKKQLLAPTWHTSPSKPGRRKRWLCHLDGGL